MFVRAKNESEAAGTASYLVSELIARNSKSFSDGAFVEKCVLKITKTVAPDKRAAFANVNFHEIQLYRRLLIELLILLLN